MAKKCFMDIHVIETVPPSCINRDDTGSPKTAIYGGAMRARVSSQCWKKAMRASFADMLPQEDIGKRTKMLHALLADAIRARNPQLDAATLALNVINAAGISPKTDKKNKEVLKTDALFFISQSQLDALADIAVETEGGKFDKKACQAALKANPAVDVALFGRMVADDPSLNFDAAAQVAHAISTHAMHNEYDYFTAVDDCAPEDNAGAGHLGTVEYNSSTLYRYATVDVSELASNLGERTPEAVRAFIRAFILSMPTGKKNTFANNVLPNAVYVTVRHDQPISFVGALESPVKTRDSGYVENSISALVKHAHAVYSEYMGEPDAAFAIGHGMDALAETMPLNTLLDKVEECARTYGGQA